MRYSFIKDLVIKLLRKINDYNIMNARLKIVSHVVLLCIWMKFYFLLRLII